MSIIPFNFSPGVHTTTESFFGNNSIKTFVFTTVPALTKTDIAISIHNTATNTTEVIAYDDFEFIANSSNIGFTITLGENIATPTSNHKIIASINRSVKNEAVFSSGSTPSPEELTAGYQGLALAMATLLLNAGEKGLSIPTSDISNISSLTLPPIDTNLSSMLLGFRKNTNNQYEIYYDTSIVDNIYYDDVKYISDNYTLLSSDREIIVETSTSALKNITLYSYNNIPNTYRRHVTIKNMSSYSMNIYHNNTLIDTAPAQATCVYALDSNLTYNILI